MSNKTIFQEKNTRLNTNNTDLVSILETINNLPEAESGSIPEASTSMTENGVYDVTNYTTAIVNVDESKKMIEFINNETEEIFNFDITSVHNYGFAYKTSLKTINLPSCTTLGTRAFLQCTGVTSIHLPEARTLATYAFSNMTSLPSIQLYGSVRIYANMFDGCSLLTKVVLNNTSSVCVLANVSAFNNTPIANGTGYIYVPDDLVDSYKTATNWSTYADQIRGTSELAPPAEPEPY